MLIVLSGLPGTGKTTIARALALKLDAVHVRVDSIEQALREEGVAVAGHGYRVGYAIAEDNLRLGRTVIADCVNPWPLTREAWHAAARRAGVRHVDIELTCSDQREHRRRIESRTADIAGHILPAWKEVVGRDYRPWDSDRHVVDTAGQQVDELVGRIVHLLSD